MSAKVDYKVSCKECGQYISFDSEADANEYVEAHNTTYHYTLSDYDKRLIRKALYAESLRGDANTKHYAWLMGKFPADKVTP